MPVNVLNLPGLKVIDFKETGHDYHVRAEPAATLKLCPHCAATRDVIGHGRLNVLVRDLPMHGKRVVIHLDAQRLRCKPCGKTAQALIPEIDGKRLMTQRLVRWIGHQSIGRPFAQVAAEVGVDEKTVKNVFLDHVAELERTVKFETPRWMGLDEIHLIRPRGIVTNIENRTVVEVLPNRNKATVAKYLAGLPGREKVRYVAMDMWAPYRDAVQATLPQARIVIDKFHVLRLANEAVERVRKELRASLSVKERRQLKRDRFVLARRERELTDAERLNLACWATAHPVLGEAHRAKEAFYAIYETAGREEAVRHYHRWRQMLPPALVHAFKPLTTAFDNWQPHIVAYFDHPITNAYTESLNNLIRVIYRLGRGYSFEALRAKILYTEGAQKRARPKSGRQRYEEIDTATVYFSRMMTRPTPDDADEINYGADINTLVKLLEQGKL